MRMANPTKWKKCKDPRFHPLPHVRARRLANFGKFRAAPACVVSANLYELRHEPGGQSGRLFNNGRTAIS